VAPKILEIGLAGAIGIAVGGFGGTEQLSWGIAQVLLLSICLMLVVLPASVMEQSHTHINAHMKIHWIPVTLVSWVGIQWIGSKYGRIGLDTHAIESSGLALVAIIAAFYVTLAVARRPRAGKRLAFYLIVLGFLEALYGLAQYLAGWQYIWNVPRRFYIGSATGTYVNHNHFAGLLEMLLPFAIALALFHFAQSWRQACRARHRSVLRTFVERLGDPEMIKGLLLFSIALVLVLAILFSLSRMGTISMLVSLCLMGCLVCAGKFKSGISALLILILLGSGAVATVWMGASPVLEHFEQLAGNEVVGQGSQGRLALWKDTLQLIRRHPSTGVGLGSFEHAFTQVQSIRVTYSAEHVHNDYLEFAADLGIPATAVLLIGIFWILGRILLASRQSDSSLGRALALGSLGGSGAILFHSLADFNLHIPANGVVFAVILAMGYSACEDKSKHKELSLSRVDCDTNGEAWPKLGEMIISGVGESRSGLHRQARMFPQ
jgi:O-antigen ligase